MAKDWDLTLFAPSPERNNPEHPWGLRRHTHFHAKEMYYAAIIVDLALRCTWSLKLSPHLDHFNDLEGGIFIMEFLEVLRRWMWIFFRVESEWGRSMHISISTNNMANFEVVRTNRGPVLDDIILGDYGHNNTKIDYD